MTYNDIQGWFTWEPIYIKMANDCPPDGTIVELGVWKGRSLAFLAEEITKLNKRVRVIGIDRFTPYGCDEYKATVRRDFQAGDTRTLYQHCRQNLDACGFPWVELIQSDCIEAAEMFSDRSIDHIFIDDLHNPDHIRKELDAWLPKLKTPTWIAGDDYPLVKEEIMRRFPKHTGDKASWMTEIK